MTDMIGIKIGFCQRCGRAIKIKTDKGIKQADWDNMATEKCRCPKKPKKKGAK